MQPYTPYTMFRFGFYLPNEKKLVEACGIHTDPFTGDLWITRAHLRGRPSTEEALAKSTHGEVWFFDRMQPDGAQAARRIKVSWTSHRWIPVDLDATKSNVALDRVILEGVSYAAVEDMEGDQIPAEFKIRNQAA